jgi:hypothetical protein
MVSGAPNREGHAALVAANWRLPLMSGHSALAVTVRCSLEPITVCLSAVHGRNAGATRKGPSNDRIVEFQIQCRPPLTKRHTPPLGARPSGRISAGRFLLI